MTRLWCVLALLLVLPRVVSAQVVILQATDYSTGATVTAVGDATTGAIRMKCVEGCTVSGVVTGDRTPNTAAPGATNVGVVGATASAAALAFTEGNLVTPRVDLSGSTPVVFYTTAGVPVAFSAAEQTNQPHTTYGDAIFGFASAATPTTASADGDAMPLWTDLFGRLHINVGLIGGIAPLMGNGVTGTGSQRVTIASDNTAIPTNVSQINGVTPLMGAGNTGTGSARVTIATDQAAFAVNAQPLAATSGGTTPHTVTSAASTNSVNVKASPGQVYTIHVSNYAATVYYLRMYNLASAPTCSSATGYVETIPVFPTSPGGRDMAVGNVYGTGIGYCITGGATSTDNTNAAVGVVGSISYK